MFYYKVYNFSVQIPFAINELVAINPCVPDIDIQEDKIQDNLESIITQGDFWAGAVTYQINEQDILLDIKNTAKYLIKNKKTVIIDRNQSVADSDIALYLLGTCFACIVMINGGFALHGSAIKMGDSCVIFTGDSGAGKSTTAARLIEKGYQLLADDVCVIAFDTEGEAIVYPAYPQLKLWDNSVEKLGYDKTILKTVSDNWQKFRLSTRNIYHDMPVKVSHIVELIPSDSDSIKCETVQGFDKLKLLLANTYRNFFIPTLGLEQAHFQFCATIAQQTDILRIERPRHTFLLDELINIVETEINIIA